MRPTIEPAETPTIRMPTSETEMPRRSRTLGMRATQAAIPKPLTAKVRNTAVRHERTEGMVGRVFAGSALTDSVLTRRRYPVASRRSDRFSGRRPLQPFATFTKW